jgi:hypothetical protein
MSVHDSVRCDRHHRIDRWYSVSSSQDRAPDVTHQGAVTMELFIAIVAFGVVLVIAAVAFDAARRAK